MQSKHTISLLFLCIIFLKQVTSSPLGTTMNIRMMSEMSLILT